MANQQVKTFIGNQLGGIEEDVNKFLNTLASNKIVSINYGTAPSTNPADGMWYSIVVTYVNG